jgi:glycogen(starch) synthase
MNKCIHSVEWWLAHEAARVLVCSEYMKWEVTRLLELAPGKVDVIPNGVHDHAWQAQPRAVAAARSRFAGAGPLIGFAGRLVYEKGAQHLVGAVPRLREEHPGLRVVIAGEGPYRSELQEEARRLKLQRAVSFTGFMTERELPAIFAATDATVVPSLYEPFGMVALEAAAAGAPLAVAATGGLAEIVQPGVTGVTFPHSDPDALASAVGTLLADEVFARRVAREAKSMVSARYSWATIADRTAGGYRAAVRDNPTLQARITGRHPDNRPTIVVPDGNLLAGAAS